MDYNYNNLNLNFGCLGVLKPFIISGVLLAAFAMYMDASSVGASRYILIVFAPPICFAPWLVLAFVVWFIGKIIELSRAESPKK